MEWGNIKALCWSGNMEEEIMSDGPVALPMERIRNCILIIRGQKVMLSNDLAELYGVEPRVLVQAVKRNIIRFPSDFMFQLNEREVEPLRSQIVILKRGQNWKYLPYAFTEQGVAMLSSVLRSERAVLVNIEIMRAFVELRRLLSTHVDLANKLNELEKKYDSQFRIVFDAIRELMKPAVGEPRQIGFDREAG